MAEQVYFGNLRKAGWVNAPVTGLDAGSYGSIDVTQYADGGNFSAYQNATHREFTFSWKTAPIDELQFLFNYRNGLFGSGLLYWGDPYANYYNALTPHWAAPFLSARDWPSLMGKGQFAEVVDVAESAYDQPYLGAKYTLSAPANTIPDRMGVLLIPPTQDLWIGFDGTATNGGVIRVQPIYVDGSEAPTQDLTLLSHTGATRLNATFSGATYRAIKFYITSTVTGQSSITLVGGDAVYTNNGIAPDTVGLHHEGRGHSGMRFKSDPTLAYVMYDDSGPTPRRYVTAAASFTEVGSWV